MKVTRAVRIPSQVGRRSLQRLVEHRGRRAGSTPRNARNSVGMAERARVRFDVATVQPYGITSRPGSVDRTELVDLGFIVHLSTLVRHSARYLCGDLDRARVLARRVLLIARDTLALITAYVVQIREVRAGQPWSPLRPSQVADGRLLEQFGELR